MIEAMRQFRSAMAAHGVKIDAVEVSSSVDMTKVRVELLSLLDGVMTVERRNRFAMTFEGVEYRVAER